MRKKGWMNKTTPAAEVNRGERQLLDSLLFSADYFK